MSSKANKEKWLMLLCDIIIAASSIAIPLILSLHCCGVYNYTSWFSSVYFPISGIPTSCCVHISDCSEADLKNATVAAQKVYREGCYELVVTFIESNMGIIAGVTFGIAFSQLAGVALACCLSHFINTNQYEMV